MKLGYAAEMMDLVQMLLQLILSLQQLGTSTG